MKLPRNPSRKDVFSYGHLVKNNLYTLKIRSLKNNFSDLARAKIVFPLLMSYSIDANLNHQREVCYEIKKAKT